VVGSCESGHEPLGNIKCGEFVGYLRTNFSGRTLLHGFGYIVYGRNLHGVSSIPLQ